MWDKIRKASGLKCHVRIASDTGMYRDVLIALGKLGTGECTSKMLFLSSVLGNVLGFFLQFKIFLCIPEMQNSKFIILESCPNPNMILCTGMHWDLVFYVLGFTEC